MYRWLPGPRVFFECHDQCPFMRWNTRWKQQLRELRWEHWTISGDQTQRLGARADVWKPVKFEMQWKICVWTLLKNSALTFVHIIDLTCQSPATASPGPGSPGSPGNPGSPGSLRGALCRKQETHYCWSWGLGGEKGSWLMFQRYATIGASAWVPLSKEKMRLTGCNPFSKRCRSQNDARSRGKGTVVSRNGPMESGIYSWGVLSHYLFANLDHSATWEIHASSLAY